MASKGTFINKDTMSNFTNKFPEDTCKESKECTNAAEFTTLTSSFPRKSFNNPAKNFAAAFIDAPSVLTIGFKEP